MASVKLSDKTGPELVEIYNKAAKQLGVSSVNRFADRKSAEKRVAKILKEVEVRGGRSAETARSVRTTPAEKPAKAKATTTSKSKPKAGGTRVAGSPRPYRDKLRNPAKVAYKPLPGTIQDQIVAKLKSAGAKGLSVEDTCKFLNGIRRGAKPITVSTVWTELAYILCDKRGYGLEAKDGRLILKEPNDVRAVSR